MSKRASGRAIGQYSTRRFHGHSSHCVHWVSNLGFDLLFIPSLLLRYLLRLILIKTAGDEEDDFTGMKVTSSEPVSVFAGTMCAMVPANNGLCDHIVEQVK